MSRHILKSNCIASSEHMSLKLCQMCYLHIYYVFISYCQQITFIDWYIIYDELYSGLKKNGKKVTFLLTRKKQQQQQLKCQQGHLLIHVYHVSMGRERSGSVVECLTRDRRVAGSSLTGVTALWSLSKTHLS